MSRHTPLPWAMVYGNDGHHHIFAQDGPIADVKVRLDADEQEANALLLLHAADLLAALKKAHAFIDDLLTSNPRIMGRSVLQDYARFNEVMIEMPAAIVKAEGVQ